MRSPAGRDGLCGGSAGTRGVKASCALCKSSFGNSVIAMGMALHTGNVVFERKGVCVTGNES